MKPRVYLLLPRLSYSEREGDIAVYVTASNDKVDLTAVDKTSSLLANGFNQGLCECVNAGNFDWFGILHADLVPKTDNWLDVLVEEATRGDYDVIHAVAAIKDGRGLTSTAVGNRLDPWDDRRRLTMTDLEGLPPTFGIDDVLRLWNGQRYPRNPCLLPNTGCMLMRINTAERLAYSGGFTIEDRITRTGIPPAGYLVPEVVPEDWGFGYWCANHVDRLDSSKSCIRIAATRAVKTDHIGVARYSNYRTWGDARDENYFRDERGVSKGGNGDGKLSEVVDGVVVVS